jgi:hypothetical protein
VDRGGMAIEDSDEVIRAFEAADDELVVTELV